MKREIYLDGSLAKYLDGGKITLDVDNVPQLMAALRAQNEQLNIAIRSASDLYIGIPETEKQDLDFGFGNVEEIHLVPATEGAGATYVAWVAIGLVVALAVRVLTASKMTGNRAAGQKSTMFSGPINSTQQGGPIPIIYGKKVLVGSTVIASDVQYYTTF